MDHGKEKRQKIIHREEKKESAFYIIFNFICCLLFISLWIASVLMLTGIIDVSEEATNLEAKVEHKTEVKPWEWEYKN